MARKPHNVGFEQIISSILPSGIAAYARRLYNPIEQNRIRKYYDDVDELEISVDGVEVLFNTSCNLSKNWFFPRYADGLPHEPGTSSLLLDCLEADSVFYDIGTHIGYFGALAARQMSSGEVHAFDIDERALACARENFELNRGETKTITVKAAISDSVDETVLFAPFPNSGFNPFGSSDRSMNRISDQLEQPLGEATTTTLDRYARNASNPDIVKIDVEGYEYATLRGARKVLSNARPSLIVAVHPAQLDELNREPSEILGLLRDYEYDYRLVNTDDSNEPLGAVPEQLSSVSVLFCRPN